MIANRHRRRPGNQSGFTLLEVLVALAIAALGISSVTQAFGTSTRAMTSSRQHQEALSRARSRLDALSVSVQEGEQTGDDGGGFRYRTLVRAVGADSRPGAGGPDAAQAPVATLFALTVWINWGGSRPQTLRLETERLHAPAPG